ncbi:MAG TPA: histidinol dehydrogenase [Thermomicrobiales bacterium]|nr:histidinol dehydrogenase [Thermomicrobiales bacterium]
MSNLQIRILDDPAEIVAALTRSRGFEEPELSERAQAGIQRVFGESLSASQVVDHILARIRTEGDAGILALTEAFDGQAPTELEVPKETWGDAFSRLPVSLQEAMQIAAQQIERFHVLQRRTSWFDTSDEGILGQLVRPIERVGVYAPGGTAVYPSSLLMTAIPARVAGVREVIACSPPHQGAVSDLILGAAHVAGIDRLFQIGGAQAIGAMAYGTETVPHVDKIYGPGNIFVVTAKQKLYGVTAIDSLPGPTETLLIADNSADPELVAADLLAQAEHDPMASAILLTDSVKLAHLVRQELASQLDGLARSDIAGASLQNNGVIGVVASLEQAVDLANAYAPEHMCLLTRSPWDLVPLVKNAGGLFIGEQSPEALADYTTGPSHVMPTGGTARFFSPIHLNDFYKVINVAAANDRALRRLGPATVALANAEGLGAHAAAITRRLAK